MKNSNLKQNIKLKALEQLSEIKHHLATVIFSIDETILAFHISNTDHKIQNSIPFIASIVRQAKLSVKNAKLGDCDFIQINSDFGTMIIKWAAVNEVLICSLFSSTSTIGMVNLAINKAIYTFLHLEENTGYLSRAKINPNIVARFVVSNNHTINQMLKLAQVNSTDILYDLGCGDAKVLIYATKNYNVKQSIGIECRNEVVALANKNITRNGLQNSITIINDDLFNIPLHNADVVFIYLSKRAGKNLSKLLKNTLPKNSKIVSQAFPLRYMEPDDIYQDTYCKLYLYTIK